MGLTDDVLRNFEDLQASCPAPKDSPLSEDAQEALLRTLSFLCEPEKLDNAIQVLCVWVALDSIALPHGPRTFKCQILDDQSLRILKSTSGRCVHVVQGSRGGKQYFCTPGYCSCESFFQAAKKTSAQVLVRLPLHAEF